MTTLEEKWTPLNTQPGKATSRLTQALHSDALRPLGTAGWTQDGSERLKRH